MSKYTVLFNGSDIEDSVPNAKITAVDMRPATRKLTSAQLARRDKTVVSSAFFTDRKPVVTLDIGGNNRASFETSMNVLNRLLQGREKALILPWANGSVQLTATYDNMAITDQAGGFGTVSIEFMCSDPFGIDTTVTQLYNYPHLVGSLYDFKCTFDGSTETQQPVTTVTINSITGGTGKAISIENIDTGEVCTITRNWVPTDVLVVDSRNKTVQVNGVDVDYTGGIPEWVTGTSNVTYVDNFTARDIALSITYQKRYA